jgi:hypothetical protein
MAAGRWVRALAGLIWNDRLSSGKSVPGGGLLPEVAAVASRPETADERGRFDDESL